MHVLFVSIAFPPKRDPECLQTAKYFKYLVEFGMDVSVVTSAVPTLNMDYDTSLEKYDKGYLQKLEYPIYESKYLNFLVNKISPATLQTPDSKKKFIKNWKKIVSDLTHKPNLIYSRSFPLTSALTALQLKKFYKIPWIMHISDPWADAPWSPTHPSIYQKNKEMEKECFDYADKISFTTEKTLDFYAKQYAHYAYKFEVFPNVYDRDDTAENGSHLPTHKLRVVYTGGMAGNRGPIFIINVIEHLRQKGFDVDNKIELILAGDVDRRNKTMLDESHHRYINFIGRQTFETAKKLQQSAHLLLIFEEPLKDVSKAMFFPSKILDYIVAKRKTFAITSKSSQVDIIFKKFGWNSFSHEELEEAAQFLQEAHSHLHEPGYFMQTELPEYFDAKKNVQRLIELMNSL
jgi:glycosyltransferase involved in cell wall biosynthesis